MKKIASLALLLCLCGSAYGQETSRPCNKAATFKYESATTGPVEIIPAVEGARIYYCGFTVIQRGQTLNFMIVVGRGTNCGSDSVSVTPQFELPADIAFTSRQETGQPMPAVGAAMCVQALGTSGKIAGMVFYSQF